MLRFFDDNETWLAAVLDEGRQAGVLQFEGSTRDAARTIVSGLEGAMLVTRLHGDPQQFQVAADRLLAGIVGNRNRNRNHPPPARRARATTSKSTAEPSTTRRR